MKRVLDETTGQFRPFYPKGRKSENPEVRSLQEQNDKLMARLEALEKKDGKVEEAVETQSVGSDFSLDMKKDELVDVAAEMNVSIPEGATKKNIFDLLTQKKEELELEAMDDSEEDGEL